MWFQMGLKKMTSRASESSKTTASTFFLKLELLQGSTRTISDMFDPDGMKEPEVKTGLISQNSSEE